MNFPEVLYTIDILFVAFVLLFAMIGLLRGFSGELASLLTLFVLLGAVLFSYPVLTQIAAENWGTLSPGAIQAVVLLILVLGSAILFFLMHLLFRQMFKERMGMVFHRIAGGFVGLMRGGLIALCLMAGLSLLPDEALYAKLSEKSVIGGWVCNTLTPWVHPRMMELPAFDQGEN